MTSRRLSAPIDSYLQWIITNCKWIGPIPQLLAHLDLHGTDSVAYKCASQIGLWNSGLNPRACNVSDTAEDGAANGTVAELLGFRSSFVICFTHPLLLFPIQEP